MYSIAKLESLANDPDFVATVRQLVAELMIADRDPNTARRLMPLRGYGPNTPGALLRLDPKLQLDITSLTDDGLQQLFAVQDQLLGTAEEAD